MLGLWIWDVSYHMCLWKEYFETLELKEGGVVRIINDKACKVQSMGSICLRKYGNCDILLHDVRHVSEYRQTLLPISMFDRLGY